MGCGLLSQEDVQAAGWRRDHKGGREEEGRTVRSGCDSCQAMNSPLWEMLSFTLFYSLGKLRFGAGRWTQVCSIPESELSPLLRTLPLAYT